MPKSDDRDVRKSHTPPAGVRAQTAQPESFEGDTPVDGDAVTQLNTRARQAAHASRDAAASSKAAFAKIGEVQREVRMYVDRDVADHERLFDSYNRLDQKIDTQNEKIDTANEKIDRTNDIVADVREQVGVISGQMTTLSGLIQEQTRAKVVAAVEVEKHEKITTIEVKKQEQIAEINNEQQTAQFKREKSLKVLGFIGTLLGLIVAVVTAAVKC